MVWDFGRVLGVVKLVLFALPVLIMDYSYKNILKRLRLRKAPSLGPLVQLCDNIWSVEYFVGSGEIPSQTIVFRNPAGELLLISPMPPTDEATRLLEPLGKVSLVSYFMSLCVLLRVSGGGS